MRLTRGDERGQAMVEALLLSWLLILFIAAAYQVFMTNETIFRSLATVHQMLFTQAFENNCADKGTAECRYTSGDRNRVTWSTEDVPEVRIPVVGLFQDDGLPSSFQLTSNSSMHGGTDKQTQVGAGTYYPISACDCLNVFADGCPGCLD